MRLPASALMLAALAGCTDPGPPVYQGYAEGDYVRVASPFSGHLVQLAVERGAQVKPGDPLFVLEQDSERASRLEAQQRLQRAEAQLADLRKGRRPDELAAVEAQHRQALAALDLSRVALARDEKLVASGFLSPQRLDEARSAFRRDQARVDELAAQRRVVRLAARPDEIRAAEAEAEAARAALAQAQWKLSQKTLSAPVAGTVHDRNYVVGEFVAAGSPVVSILPPENVKLRFFVPEPVLASVKPGQAVHARCDGCGGDIPATVSFVSTQAEFTPPVIYSRDSRSKLVYLVEARLAAAEAARLHPGQPVDVYLR